METLTIESLIQYLNEEIVFSKSILRPTEYYGEIKEKRVQKSLYRQLISKFGKEVVATEYTIGGHWKMAIDVDLFDGMYGIELKLAEQLRKNASNVERLLGQVVYYNKRRYKGNMIVLILGKSTEYDSTIQELGEFIHDLGAHIVFKGV